MTLTESLHQAMPLCATLDIRALDISPEAVQLELDWGDRLCTVAGMLHGGAVMALADAAGGACAAANLPAGAIGTSTIESKTNFLAAARDGVIRATSRPLHVGSTTIVIETEARHVASGRLIAKTTQTQSILRPRA